MSRTEFALLMAALAVTMLTLMWWGWRARARRDEANHRGVIADTQLSGETLASFPKLRYVSTTLAGAPFSRIALPGLRYTGYARLEVRSDGVSIEIISEHEVVLRREQLYDVRVAQGRVGKFVETDGLVLLVWRAASEAETPDADAAPATALYETSFRAADAAEQLQLIQSLNALLPVSAAAATPTHFSLTHDDNAQEDA